MFPAVNQMVQIISFNEGNEEKKYKALVADSTSEHIMLTYPIEEKSGRTSLLLDGWTVYVSYNHPDGAQYEFLSVIVGKQRENIPMLVLLKPAKDNIRRIQRRDYLRVPAKVELEFSWQAQDGQKTYTGLTVDISGGGIKFVCKAGIPFPEENIIACQLYLPEINTQNKKTNQELCIPLKAKIIRQPMPDGNGLQTVAVTYEEIAELHRERIIRYCFFRQLEIRNKGVL